MADFARHREQHEGAIATILLLLLRDEGSYIRGLLGLPPSMSRVSMFDLARLQGRLQTALVDRLAETFSQAAVDLLGRVPTLTELAQIREAAARWAAQRAAELAKDLVDTTLERLAKAVGKYTTPQQFAAELEKIFGDVRAESIAITEVTRAISAGELVVAESMAGILGRRLIRIWNTEKDERVCPICAPLHERTDEKWGGEFPKGPPAHPRCRCWLSYRIGASNEVIGAL